MIGPENMRSAASEAFTPHGQGSRGPHKGPGRVQGHTPWRGSRGQRPQQLVHFEHFKAILDAFPGSTGALQASTQRGNCFMFTLTCFTINWEIQSITGCKVNNFFMYFLNDNCTWITSFVLTYFDLWWLFSLCFVMPVFLDLYMVQIAFQADFNFRI